MNKLLAMEVFARVAQAGSFTRAAAALGLSRSAASDQVAELERHLGVRLLNRTTRRVGLTPEGEAFLERALQVLALVEEAEAEASAGAASPRGLLRVNAPVSFGQRHLAPALGAFLERHPAIDVELTLTDRSVDLIEEGYDLALRIGPLPDSSLRARRIAPIRTLLCAAPSYLAKAGTPQRPEDLARHHCLRFLPPENRGAWFAAVPGGGHVLVPSSSRFATNNVELLLAATLAGHGIAHLPSFVAGDALREGRLVMVLPDHPMVRLDLHALYPPGRLMAPKTRALIDFLLGRVGGDRPYWDADIEDVAAGGAALPSRPRKDRVEKG